MNYFYLFVCLFVQEYILTKYMNSLSIVQFSPHLKICRKCSSLDAGNFIVVVHILQEDSILS
jgi:hypothetical protein